jgi:hypothetical protein
LRHDAELRDTAQIVVAQSLGPRDDRPSTIRERLGVGERALEQPRHELGDFGNDGQLIAGGAR